MTQGLIILILIIVSRYHRLSEVNESQRVETYNQPESVIQGLTNYAHTYSQMVPFAHVLCICVSDVIYFDLNYGFMKLIEEFLEEPWLCDHG